MGNKSIDGLQIRSQAGSLTRRQVGIDGVRKKTVIAPTSAETTPVANARKAVVAKDASAVHAKSRDRTVSSSAVVDAGLTRVIDRNRENVSLKRHEAQRREELGATTAKSIKIAGSVKSVKRNDEAERKEIEKMLKKIEREEKRNKRGKKKRSIKFRIIRTAVIVLAVIVGIGSGLFGFAYAKLSGFLANISGGEVSLIDVLSADPGEPLKTDKDGMTNIMIIGTEGYSMDDANHPGSQLSDTMMVVRLNQKSGEIFTFSLPRDLYAKKYCTATGKLNEVYWCTYSKKKDEAAGNKAVIDVVSDITGIEFQYWAHANWSALIGVVDAVGGIDMEVAQTDEDCTGKFPCIVTNDKRGIKDVATEIDWKNGEKVHLNGERALAVARARGAYGGYGLGGSNFAREITQQKIVEAVLKKVQETSFIDINAWLKIMDSIGDNLRMSPDLVKKMKRMAYLAGKFGAESINQISLVDLFSTASLPIRGCSGESCQYLSYVVPSAGTHNYTQIREYIAKRTSADPVQREGAKVAVLNGAPEIAGVARDEESKLRELGYNVARIGNAPEESIYTETVIYQLNPDMKGTAKALAKEYGVKVKTKIPEALKDSVEDFIVIVVPKN